MGARSTKHYRLKHENRQWYVLTRPEGEYVAGPLMLLCTARDAMWGEEVKRYGGPDLRPAPIAVRPYVATFGIRTPPAIMTMEDIAADCGVTRVAAAGWVRRGLLHAAVRHSRLIIVERQEYERFKACVFPYIAPGRPRNDGQRHVRKIR